VNHREAVNCPLCESWRVENILNLNCGRFDTSTLYRNAVINSCNDCGHIYNRLSAAEMEGLGKYYNDEYGPVNMNAAYKTGNKPGGGGDLAFQRYDTLFRLISPYLKSGSRVLDVGCALGGFLDYLHERGVSHLSGIDLTEDFVDHARHKDRYNIKRGGAESIPFEAGSFDVLVVNQVIEHLADPRKVFSEAGRTLANGGILYLGTPDARRYGDAGSFDFYWFLIRDHIQHFDVEHLRLLAAKEGFEVSDFSKNDNLALSEELAMPNLNVIFRRTGQAGRLDITENCLDLKTTMKNYITGSFAGLTRKQEIIDWLRRSQMALYLWGIGGEFLYLYENTRLRDCNIAGLIDVNPYKQAHFTVGGLPVLTPGVLAGAEDNSGLLITATAYKRAIQKTLPDLNYKGQTVDLQSSVCAGAEGP
jgi:2-polyprenyl-3-methyl-5-hydroxy-6-metoxy-1,4-benzoquinol methylase